MNKHNNIYKTLYAQGLRGAELEKAYDARMNKLVNSLDDVINNLNDEDLTSKNCHDGKCAPYSEIVK